MSRSNKFRTQVHWVRHNESVTVLKEMMFEWTGVPIGRQRLRLAGYTLENHKALSDYALNGDCTISCTARICGDIDVSLRHGQGWPPRMQHLELDHYHYLLEKVNNIFRLGGEPHKEV